MVVEVEELYNNLNQLLDDICKFLSDESNYDKLSLLSRKQADELIKRSKLQLQKIEKIQNDNNEPDEAYVDMERKPAIDENDDKNDIYSSVDENTVITRKSDPYTDLLFKDLSQDIKYGQLSWRTRIILNFEKMRRIYAGIHDNWLLIYSNEKDDQKPIQTFDLKFHKAKTVTYKQAKNSPQDFELISTIESKKVYYFGALTPKDMLQWVANINRCHELVNQTRKSTNSDISETYDTIVNIKQFKNNQDSNNDNKVDDYNDDIYHDIEPLSIISNKNKTEDKPPDLPSRHKLKKIAAPLPPIPIPIKKNNSVQSLPSYDPVGSQKSTTESEEDNNENSFSESNSDDDIYEVFVTTTAVIEQQPKKIDEKSNNITIIKDKPAVKEKPKHLMGLKKL